MRSVVLLSPSYFMDKQKYLARMEDDLVSQNLFSTKLAEKTKLRSMRQQKVDLVLSDVIREKEKKAQEEKVKKEADALSTVQQTNQFEEQTVKTL